MKQSFTEGRTGSGDTSTPSAPIGQPAWATAMKRRQAVGHGVSVAAHTLRSGDGGGGGSAVDVSEKD
jgi:type IV secretion system protein TrbL